MHHIHHTHGFVISSRAIGEANKMLVIYTRELGLIRAAAQGIRRRESKLRFALQDFSYAKIDLVRGRDIWRVTTAEAIDVFAYARSSNESLLLIARISKLIERLCNGEEANEVIFDDFIQALYLLNDPDLSEESREALELHVVLRIMHALGYVGDAPLIKEYLAEPFKHAKTKDLLTQRASIISHINKALNESGL